MATGRDGSRIAERVYVGKFEVYRRFNTAGTETLRRNTLHVRDDVQSVALIENRRGNER